MTQSTFDPSTDPDVQAFNSWKYGHRGLWIMLLPSGRVAVAGADRRLKAILEPLRYASVGELWDLLASARDSEPPPDPSPRAPLPDLEDEDLADLDLRI